MPFKKRALSLTALWAGCWLLSQLSATFLQPISSHLLMKSSLNTHELNTVSSDCRLFGYGSQIIQLSLFKKYPGVVKARQVQKLIRRANNENYTKLANQKIETDSVLNDSLKHTISLSNPTDERNIFQAVQIIESTIRESWIHKLNSMDAAKIVIPDGWYI